jgi:hypothetical protein
VSVPEFRILSTTTRGRSLVAAAVSLALAGIGLLATVALAPGASASTRSPSCTRHALWQGLSRGDEQVHHARIVRPFGCDGSWAYAAVETSRFELTSLLRAHGGEWVTVERGRPCARREVPRRIRHAACDSN